MKDIRLLATWEELRSYENNEMVFSIYVTGEIIQFIKDGEYGVKALILKDRDLILKDLDTIKVDKLILLT